MNTLGTSGAHFFFASLALVCALCCPPALAQGATGKSSANLPLAKANPEAIRARAAQVKEFQKLMNDPDATVRLSALDSMLSHDDGLIRDMGFELGFASSDFAVRSLALRTKLFQSKQLVVELGELIDSKGVRSRNEQSGTTTTIYFREFDVKTGVITDSTGSSAKVSGVQFTWSSGSYSLLLRLQDNAILKGTYQSGQTRLDATAVLQ